MFDEDGVVWMVTKRKEPLVIIAVALCLYALAFDMLGVFYGFGGIGNLAIVPMFLELFAIGLICYTIGRFAISLIFLPLLVCASVAGEILYVDISTLQPLGLILFYAFLFLLPIVAVACFWAGRSSGGRPR